MKVPDSELAALFALEKEQRDAVVSLLESFAEVHGHLAQLDQVPLAERNPSRAELLLGISDDIEDSLFEAEEMLAELSSLIEIVLDGQWAPSELDILEGVEGFSE